MVIKQGRMFIWNPPPSTRTISDIKIAGVSYKAVVFSGMVKGTATTAAGYCEMTLRNKGGEYNNTFNTGDIVQVWSDYVDGTNQIFEGRLTTVKFDFSRNSAITISALDYSGDALKKIVNEVYTAAADVGQIFSDLITKYLASLGHTATGVNTATGYTWTPTWQNKTLMECLKELVSKTDDNYAFYCDFTKNWQFFEKGSVYNSVEAVVYGGNLKTLTWDKDEGETFNRITLIGGSVNGMNIKATVGTGSSEKVMSNSDITDWDALNSKANSILNSLSTLEYKGEAKCSLMPTIKPGDDIYVFAPDQNLQDEYYVTEYTHNFGSKTYTSVKFQEKARIKKDLPDYIIDTQKQVQDQISSDDIYGLKNAVVLQANVTDFTGLSGVSISNGIIITTGAGTATSRTITASANVSSFSVKVVGEDLSNISLTAAFDNSSSPEAITRDTLYAPVVQGTAITVYVKLNASTARASAVGVYWT
jgi:hypothetical protein